MVGLVGQGSSKGRLPVGEALPGRAVDEINGRRQARFLRPLNNEGNALGRMRAVQRRQDRGHSGLHAEGHSGETGVSKSGKPFARHRVRIGLERHLCTGGDADTLTQPRQDLNQLGGIEHGGRSAAEKDSPSLARGQPGLGHDAGGQRGLGQDRRGIVPHLRAGPEAHRVGVEVAVAASHATKRHVHVQGERTPGLS